ncbi:MAG: hypothetical protein RH982_13480 [Parvibaculum sp.]
MFGNPASALAIIGGALAATFSAHAADYECSATRQTNLSQIGVTESLQCTHGSSRQRDSSRNVAVARF